MIHWSSLWFDQDGDINYALVRQFIVMALGLCGGLLLLLAGFNEVFGFWPGARTDHLAMISGALITPVTGGVIIDKIKGKADTVTAEQVASGVVPDRRAPSPTLDE